eukprot:439312-Prymnesium_polylepis.3
MCPPTCMRYRSLLYWHVPRTGCPPCCFVRFVRLWHEIDGTGSGELRVCRCRGAMADTPPQGGLEPVSDEDLQPDSVGSGTCLNTFNTTPGNTTHGTSQLLVLRPGLLVVPVGIPAARHATTACTPTTHRRSRPYCLPHSLASPSAARRPPP